MKNKFIIIFKYIIDIIRVLLLKKDNSNILFFGYEDSTSGAAVLSLYMVKELSKKYNIVFITPDKKDLDQDFQKYSKLILRVPNKRIYKHLYKKGFANAVLNALPACFDAQYLKESGFHIIALIHELHYLIDEFNLHDDVDRAKSFSDVLIFPSNFCYQSFRRYYGEVNCKVLIKPQGLFLTKDYESNKIENHQYIYGKHKFDNSKSIVLMVGLGDKRKGMDMFFDLCFTMNDEPIQFVHIGAILGDMENYCLGKYGFFPKNFINVDFISDSKELFKYYDAATVLLMLSREEPFGSVVLESFSAKTPVIGFKDSGGYNDIVINGKTGILVDYMDVDAIRREIINIVNDDKYRFQLGNGGYRLVSKMTFDNYIAFISKEFL